MSVTIRATSNDRHALGDCAHTGLKHRKKSVLYMRIPVVHVWPYKRADRKQTLHSSPQTDTKQQYEEGSVLKTPGKTPKC